MAKLIATLGTSPGGVVETFNFLVKEMNEEITDIYIITTEDKSVKKAWEVVKILFTCCVKQEFPQIQIAEIPSGIRDIESPEDLRRFMETLSGKIEKNDFVDITGGRKGMSVAVALMAREAEAKIITSIIPQSEYKEINERLSKISNIPQINETNCPETLKEDYCNMISKNAKTILFDL
ncbi:CRISPR-associated ring nuclease Crn1 [Acidianus sp. RZ1]|uniref:CRISPR-associated ring nuclease Crn1 n=1 Tax=Acidianus sp. RZ1 TaxID=1540082 RepID=UPI0014912FE4|nr:CRISPR-associated ring nuclease Crn1 [Acidianus sp. RZ1]NON62270.1 hypothetical protein [Acidianus sp. RZ1]